MTRKGGIEKEKPSSTLDPRLRSVLTSLMSYTTGVDEEIEDIHHFRSWSLPKFAEYDVQLSRMRSEIYELRHRADSTDSQLTPHDNRTPEKKAIDDAKIAKLVAALQLGANVERQSQRFPSGNVHTDHGSTRSNANDPAPGQVTTTHDDSNSPVPDPNADYQEDVPVEVPVADDQGQATTPGYIQRETARQRAERGELGSPALARNIQGLPGRPCTFPADPRNSNLTFDETPTQDPGDYDLECVGSYDDDRTLPPTPPPRAGKSL